MAESRRENEIFRILLDRTQKIHLKLLNEAEEIPF